MAEVKPLYSTCVAVLGFICFVVGATAVGIPMWGYFDTVNGKYRTALSFYAKIQNPSQSLVRRFQLVAHL